MKKVRFDIEGMTCAACQAHVLKATEKLDGVIDANVNLLNNNMDVTFDEDKVKEEDIVSSVIESGYGAKIHNEKESNNKILENKKDHSLRDLIISFIFLFILMYVSMGNMMWNFPLPPIFDMKENKMGFALIQFILVLPICYIYRRYFINGFKRLFKGSSNMDTLIAIGATASLIYGIISLFMISYGYYLVSIGNGKGNDFIETYHMNLYFEAAGMILTLVSLGKYLEGLSKKKTTVAIDNLMDLAPKKANIIKDGKEYVVGVEEVKVDDILIVRQGDAIPVDGIVIEGNASINEANITGEAIPVYKDLNDFCYSSTIVESGFIKIKATKVGDDSSINTIIKLVEEASNSKAPISKMVDKISNVFVPTILILSLITFIVNFILALTTNLVTVELSLNFAITVVVIACPCALGLATPVAIMVSTGKGASNGLLIKNAAILENTSKINTIVFDKTGTITLGKPIVTDYEAYDDSIDLKSIIYSIENSSNHPLAKSLIEYTKDSNLLTIDNLENIEGEGLKANILNDTYYIGNIKYLKKNNKVSNELIEKIDNLANDGKTVLIILKNDNLIGLVALKDLPKENSKKAIERLNSLGIKTVMLTGDNYRSAESIAKEVGIKEVIAEVLPVDKGNVLKLLKNDKGLVAMVGDGVNDAIALAEADIAISVGNASDVAINASDVVLLHNDLMDISNVIRLSRRTLNTIKLSLFWAFFYNVICVFLATGVLYYINGFKISPMIGSIAMSISSVSVVLTALTINLFKVEKINKEIKNNEIEIKVKGMMCEKCVAHVEEASKKVNNVLTAKASLKNKNVIITYKDNVNVNEIIDNIEHEGYKAKEVKR